MEFQDSVLLSNEENEVDLIDEEKKKNFTKELNILNNEIRKDLNKLSSCNNSKVSRNELLNYLQSKLPPK